MHLIRCIFFLATTVVVVLAAGQVETVFEWKSIGYSWNSLQQRDATISRIGYDQFKIVPTDVNKDKSGRVFVSFLGQRGVPATLGVVTNTTGSSGPLIKPYPNWSWFKPDDCKALKNIYKIAIDKCNRLWVLDTGYSDKTMVSCEAQLVVFDLTKDSWIKTIKVSNNIRRNKNKETLLTNLVVKANENRCENTTVYIADSYGNALIVYADESINRLESPAFKPDPAASLFESGKNKRDMSVGIFGMDISPEFFPNEVQYLYLRPLSSYSMFGVDVDLLHGNINDKEIEITEKSNILTSQAPAMAFSSKGTLFYGLTRENAIGCWNKYRPMTPETIGVVAKDNERLQYLSSMKVIPPSPAQPEEELWILSSRYLGFVARNFNHREVNFRVLKTSVKKIIQDTICELPQNIRDFRETYIKQRNINKSNTE